MAETAVTRNKAGTDHHSQMYKSNVVLQNELGEMDEVKICPCASNARNDKKLLTKRHV